MRILLLAGLILLGSVAGPSAPSQESGGASPAAQQLIVITQTVFPPRLRAYEEAQKQWVAAARKAKLGKELAWEAAQRDPFTFFYFIRVQESLDYESYVEQTEAGFRQALGDGRYEELRRAVSESIRDSEAELVERIAEMSYTPENPPAGEMRFAHVDVELVRSDRVEAYRAVTGRIVDAMQRARFPFALNVYRSLTEENVYYTVIPLPNRQAQLERIRFSEEALPRVVGQKAWQKLVGEWMDCLDDFDHYEETARPDLSYRPDSQPESGKP